MPLLRSFGAKHHYQQDYPEAVDFTGLERGEIPRQNRKNSEGCGEGGEGDHGSMMIVGEGLI